MISVQGTKPLLIWTLSFVFASHSSFPSLSPKVLAATVVNYENTYPQVASLSVLSFITNLHGRGRRNLKTQL